MPIPYQPAALHKAKRLRRNMTPQEKHLWYDFLAKYTPRFQRQKPVSGFIVDFYCASVYLAVELDGRQHQTDAGKYYDRDRSEILGRHGILVIRFDNADVENRFDWVCSRIDDCVRERAAGEMGIPLGVRC